MQPDTYAISGTVTGDVHAGVVVQLSGAEDATAITDAAGFYTFPALSEGNYTVTIAMDAYTFEPEDRRITVADSNEPGQDFIASAEPERFIVASMTDEVMVPGTWPFPNVPKPSAQWWAGDPTGANAGTGEETTTDAWTLESGELTVTQSPFSPTGMTGYLPAINFDGTTSLSAADSPAMAWNGTGNFTACALLHASSTDSMVAVGKYVWPGPQGGWSIYFTDGKANAQAGTSGGFATDHEPLSVVNGWSIVCTLIEQSPPQNQPQNQPPGATDPAAQTNAVYSVVNGWPANYGLSPDGWPLLDGTVTESAPTLLGRNVGGDAYFKGPIAAVWFWRDGLSMAETRDFSYAVMGYGNRDSVRFITDGYKDNCYWHGTPPLLDCYSPYFLSVNATSGPGMLPAGQQDGAYVWPPLEIANTHSRQLSAGWTAVGTDVLAPSPSSFWRDGRTTWTITDNDPGASEYIHQAIDISTVPAGTPVAVCATVATQASSGSASVVVQESGGAGCAAPEAVALGVRQTSATPAMRSWTFNVTDGACSTLDVAIHPHDGTPEATGHVAAEVRVFVGQDWCPSSVGESIETPLAYGYETWEWYLDGLVGSFIDESGRLLGRWSTCVDWTPFTDGVSAESVLIAINSLNPVEVVLWVTADSELKLTSHAMPVLTSVPIPIAAGVPTRVCMRGDYDEGIFQVLADGVVVGSATAVLPSPPGLAAVQFGSNWHGEFPVPGGSAYANVEVGRW